MKPGQIFTPLANCHAKGLFSIPLKVTDAWAERMFVDSLGQCHTVAPHNHRYGLGLELVSGRMAHSLWREDELGAIPAYQHRWTPPSAVMANGEFAIAGHFELISDEKVRYNVETTYLHPGDSLQMDETEIHSLVTEPGTSWIITEGLDVVESEDCVTLAFKRNYNPDLSGLYVPIGV